MKLQFKIQDYQTAAVDSVVDCFAGQPLNASARYHIAPGNRKELLPTSEGFKNAAIQISEQKVLANIREVQKRQNLPISSRLFSSAGCKYNLDLEMETGTGKTYCYIKTIFEMNKRYGWSKFVVMTPSIAIREGVYKSLEMTGEHFFETYQKKVRFFIYNSRRLHEIESFSSEAGINIMVVNIQAFNARGADQRRIYEELDDFQSRRPIDVIKDNNPILILDEPQKMSGKATMGALAEFEPLMILRYSATHKKNYNKVHRLDALDAYNQKLVKKIAVRGIDIRGLSGTNAYLYLESIEISKDAAPIARVEMEVVKLKSGKIRRQRRRLKLGDNLYKLSGNLVAYQGFTVSQIDYNKDSVEFINGHELFVGRAVGNFEEQDLRRIQIRETIQVHLDKEKQLYKQGIKVLSLFFIDEVAKYRDYNQEDEKGEYARLFEEEYERILSEHIKELSSGDAYREFLQRDETANVHEGYFAVDKKKRLANPKVKQRGEEKGLSDDVNAYDLILKDKERLLSQTEPVRFIFSHSALREGWDNPNVFVICMLKHSDNTISRRQEVGRGLRLSVNREGERTDDLAIVHDINILTVVAGESYKDFVLNLQREVSEALSARPRQANEAYFTGKEISTEKGRIEITLAMAKQIYRYLLKNDYTDDEDHITENYHQAKEAGKLADLPKSLQAYAQPIFELIDSVFSEDALPKPADDRKPKRNPWNEKNFQKKEFQELWSRINHKAIYQVEFDSDELVRKSIRVLDEELRVTPLQFQVKVGIQKDAVTKEQMQYGDGFLVEQSATEYGRTVPSESRYDLVGNVSKRAGLMRKTAAKILGAGTSVFNQFTQNPEHFIAQASRIITEQKGTMIIEHIQYNQTDGRYNKDIFTANQSKQDLSKATRTLKKHIYQYAVTDSKVERDFVGELDSSSEVVVYAKLPRGFLIPTPIGSYNPDWAISFNKEQVQYIYFVAETKGSMSTMHLRKKEDIKIKCAHKFFDEINQRIEDDRVEYRVVSDYGELMNIVRPKAK